MSWSHAIFPVGQAVPLPIITFVLVGFVLPRQTEFMLDIVHGLLFVTKARHADPFSEDWPPSFCHGI